MSENVSDVMQVDGVQVLYGKHSVLWNVSFNVPKACMVGIVGPNGAGKSTLLKALVGALRPVSGQVTYSEGIKVAYVPQKESIDWDFPITVLDVALMGRYGQRKGLKWVRTSDKEASLKMLERLGLLELKDRQISELSGGQQQRLFITRALLQEPDIFLLDEPFKGVDLTTEHLIVDLFKELKNKGKTIVMVHHDLNTVDTYFDHVVMLNTSVIAAGPVNEVFSSSNLSRTYGHTGALFDEVTRLSQAKSSGISL